MSTVLSQPTPYPHLLRKSGTGLVRGCPPKTLQREDHMTEEEKPKYKAKAKFIKIRVTETERLEWQQKAKDMGMTLADYMRTLADQKVTGISPVQPVKNRKFAPVDPALLRQIAWIGNNLNQIAKRVNEGDKTDLAEHLISIDRQLKEIANAL